MPTRSLILLTAIAASLAALAPAQCLPTIYARNNGGSLGGAVYFDLNVTNPGGITVTSLDTNTAELALFNVDVYTAPTTYQGNENSMGAWTMVSTGMGIGQGINNPSSVDVADFPLAPGSHGIALVMSGSAGHDYTNGNGTNQTYMNNDVTLMAGAATNVPFTGNIFSPRVWNGQLFYTAPGSPPCASTNSFGTGCGPLPLTVASTRPILGSTVTVDTMNVPANTPIGANVVGFFMFMPGVPLASLGAPGCEQYVNLEAATVWLPTGTQAQWQFGVPNDPLLSGVTFGIQSASVSPGINQFGMVTSNGVSLVIGS